MRRERADLQHTVQVMADLGLTYVQTKNIDGTYQYHIEPDISFLFNFKGTYGTLHLHKIAINTRVFISISLKPDYNACARPPASVLIAANQRSNELTYSNMQIIAREVELEVMRRATPTQGPQNPAKKPPAPKPQNHLQKLTTRSINPARRTKDLVCTHTLRFSVTFARISQPIGGQRMGFWSRPESI